MTLKEILNIIPSGASISPARASADGTITICIKNVQREEKKELIAGISSFGDDLLVFDSFGTSIVLVAKPTSQLYRNNVRSN